MTELRKQRFGFDDTPAVDAFGRLRVSAPTALFDSQLQYGKQDLAWDEALTAGGTSTHLPNESAVDLNVTTASGDKVIRQQHGYNRYQPGKSQFVILTFVFDTQKANLRQRVGYFDIDNGLFLEDDGTNYQFVRRTKTSGAVIDNPTNQASWNVDPFDGTGPSGITLTPTNGQILWIDLQWLSLGRVRFGFEFDGVRFVAHEEQGANVRLVPYMSTANLPIRYEIDTTGVVGSASSLKQLCASVSSEGGFETNRGLRFGDGNGITAINATVTALAIFTIRPRATFNGIPNRGIVIPLNFEVLNTGTVPVVVQLIRGGVVAAGSFANVDAANSLVESSVTNGAVAGGQVIFEGFAPAGKNPGAVEGRGPAQDLIILANDIAGTTTDELSVVLQANSGSQACQAAINWKELY